MSFGADVRTCLMCVGMICFSSPQGTVGASQAADNTGTDSSSELNADKPGVSSYFFIEEYERGSTRVRTDYSHQQL